MPCCVFSQVFSGKTRFLVGVLVLALCAGITAIAVRAAADKGDRKVDRVYELRTYYAAPGKIEALHARFRDHTLKLFERHGITVEGFWKPLDEKLQAEKLIYLLSFPSKAAADQSWKEFREDPDWIKAKAESEKGGKLLLRDPESIYLISTDYSPVK